MTILEKLEAVMTKGDEGRLCALEDFVMDEVPPLIKANEALSQRVAFLELELAEARNRVEELENECQGS